ncbi:hypothetical protein QRD02_04565 [Aequorivita sp. SDUM287046]|uniref:Uncharacterized protein n=1 Tax=Aequorivita aurantiaca TaxID=3053356 RepID=A0ABT8DFI6_9FLAO|nr:hypothetical protein [Aequorivita aurantiaca]MDN3723643.1 hypothetical protein [Aequorivita aurantiaca]
MRKLLMSLVLIGFSYFTMEAQVNKSVKEESTTQRVVIKEGSDIKITETKKTETESGGLIIENNNKIDRNFSEVTRQDTDQKIIVNDEFKDAENETLIEKRRLAQQAELDASKKKQAELAAQKKMEYEAKQAQMQKELEERKAALEKRPKGMAKLKTE